MNRNEINELMKDRFEEYAGIAERNYDLPNAWQLANYIVYGHNVGGFLRNVICNNLCEAACQADTGNSKALANYGRFLAHHAPMRCYGSVEKYANWGGIIDTYTPEEVALD